MYSMTLASVGWGCWWVAFFLRRIAGVELSVALVGSIADVFAIVGLVLAFLTIRSKRTWLLFAFVAMMANGALLFVPWMLEGLELGPR